MLSGTDYATLPLSQSHAAKGEGDMKDELLGSDDDSMDERLDLTNEYKALETDGQIDEDGNLK